MLYFFKNLILACDECTQILFNTIDSLWDGLNKTLDIFKDGIGPPWPILQETFDKYHLLTIKFDNSIVKGHELIKEANLPFLEDKLHKMKKNLNKNNQTLVRQIKSVTSLEEESKHLNNQVHEYYQKIQKIIKDLDSFGNSHIDTKQALKEAKKILQDITEKSKQIPTIQDYKNLFAECNKIYKQIKDIYDNKNLNPDNLKSKLNDLKKRLSNLNTILDYTDNINKIARNKNKINTNRISQLNQTINNINSRNYLVNEDISQLLRKLNATTDLLLEIEKIFEILSELDIPNSAGKIRDDDDTIPDIYNIISSVGDHVKDLQNKIKTYKNLFNFTNEEWKKINASGAYDNLIKGINEAKLKTEEAERILKDAINETYPENDDSLSDKTNLAKAFSDRLQKRVNNLKNPTEGESCLNFNLEIILFKTIEFKKTLEDLEKLKYDILKNGRNNNDLTTVLHNLSQQLKKQKHHIQDLEKVKEDARNISDRMAVIEQNVKDMNITTQYELIKTYQKYRNLTSMKGIFLHFSNKLRHKNPYVHFSPFILSVFYIYA